ncbi:Retinol-binding protein 3 [Manis javanica]|nr:Retinol-binding protein 3 [Manis javanica]
MAHPGRRHADGVQVEFRGALPGGRSLCYPQAGAAGGPVEQFKGYSYRTTANLHGIRAELFELPGFPATYSLERLGSVPSACRNAPATDPATTFKALSDVIALDYAFLKERNIDWPQITSRLAPRAAAAANDDALQAVMSEALKDFNDAFEAQTEVKDFLVFQELWKARVREDLASRLQGGSGPVLGGTMVWGRLPGNVGYIEIGSMGEFSSPFDAHKDMAAARAEMDRALAALADTRALIVDVSLNTLGGLDQVSAEMAGSFTRQRVLGFTKQAHRPQGRSEQSWYVEPRGSQTYARPVQVLTSDLTVSAAETFTLMMRALPQVTQIAFAYVGPVGDGGYTFAHDQGRLALEKEFGDKIKTSYVESVPEGSDAERVLRDMAANGNKLVFGTTFGYMEPIQKIAPDFPDVKFEHATGYKTAANVSTYDSRTYEGAYLAGIIAGSMTKSNVLGVVGSVPIPEVLRNINSFTLGAQSMNPKIKTKNTDSAAVLKTAEEKDKRAFGWDSDMTAYGPKAHLGSAIINWTPYYTKTVREMLDGKWSSQQTWWGVKEGAIDIVSLADDVPAEAKAKIEEVKKGLKDGTFHIWKGPIAGQDGKELLAADAVAEDKFLTGINFYVKGVEGKVPGQDSK